MDAKPDRIPTPLGDFMEERRISLGISKRKAAKWADISDTQWRAIADGKVSPDSYRDETLTKIAKGLDVPPRIVFDKAGREWRGSEQVVINSDVVRELQAMDDALRRLTALLAGGESRGAVRREPPSER